MIIKYASQALGVLVPLEVTSRDSGCKGASLSSPEIYCFPMGRNRAWMLIVMQGVVVSRSCLVCESLTLFRMQRRAAG